MKQTSTFTTFLTREIPLPRNLRWWPKLPQVLKHEGRFERFLILIYALAAAFLGYGLLAAPEPTLHLLQAGAFGPGPTGDSMLRFTGALLGGLGVTLLCLLPMTAPEVLRRIAVGLYVTTSVLFYFQVFILWGSGSSYAVLILTFVLVAVTGILATVLGVHRKESGSLQRRWRDQIQEAAAQQERNRLARDLHDSIKQQIFSIRVASATVEARWATDPVGAQEALAHVRKSAQEAAVEMQALLHQLRPEPLANAGLVEALREQCEALAYRTGAQVEVEIGELPPDEQLPPSTQEALFRVAQEALSNVARHARATRVHVRLGPEAGDEGALALEIHDDGRGFDPAQPGGMGLRNMRDRLQPFGGGLKIESTAGSGSRLSARLPLAGVKTAQPSRPATREEETLRGIVTWALALSFFAVVAPMVPERRMPLPLVGLLALFSGLVFQVMTWRSRSEAVTVSTALPKAFVLCLACWSFSAVLHEPYLGRLSSLNFLALGLLPSIGLLGYVFQDFFRRLPHSPAARAKGRHIWLRILQVGFLLSLPLVVTSFAPYATIGMCVIVASLFYMVWWVRESL